jgi:isopenicillin N synthase-like dioxygenase
MFCFKCRKQRKSENYENRDEPKPVVSSASTTASLPPLKPLDLPKILLEHQFALSDQGWSTVTYDGPDDSLFKSSEALFKAGKTFFDLPDSYKDGFKTAKGSEEGWSRVEGEKEFITLRTLGNTPEELKEAASTYWRIAGAYLNQLLGYLAKSLDLPAEALTVYSEPCIKLGPERTATMLRIFRYEGFEGQQSKVVAERKSRKSQNFQILL